MLVYAIFLLDLCHFLFNSGHSVRRILRLRSTVPEPDEPFTAVCADREIQVSFFSAISSQGNVGGSLQAVAQGFLSFFVEYWKVDFSEAVRGDSLVVWVQALQEVHVVWICQ